MSEWVKMVVQSSVDAEKRRVLRNEEYLDFSVREFLHEIEVHLINALEAEAMSDQELAKEEVRRISALASLCMETHGFSNG